MAGKEYVDGPALEAQFSWPLALKVDREHGDVIYVVDGPNLRRVANGRVDTVASLFKDQEILASYGLNTKPGVQSFFPGPPMIRDDGIYIPALMFKAGFEKEFVPEMYNKYGDVYAFIFRVRQGHFEIFSAKWIGTALEHLWGGYDESTGESFFPALSVPGSNLKVYFPYYHKTTPRLFDAYGRLYLLCDTAEDKYDYIPPSHLFEVTATGQLKDICIVNTYPLYGRFGMAAYHKISPRHSAILPGKAPGQFFFADGNNSISTFSAADGTVRLYCDHIRDALDIYQYPNIVGDTVYFLNSDGIFRMLEDGNLTKVIGSQEIDYGAWPKIGYISAWDMDSQGNAIILDFTNRAVRRINLPRVIPASILSINGQMTGAPIIRPGNRVLVPLNILVDKLIPGGYMEDVRTVRDAYGDYRVFHNAEYQDGTFYIEISEFFREIEGFLPYKISWFFDNQTGDLEVKILGSQR